MKNPFHEGELEMQRLAGEEDVAARNGAMIGDRILAGAIPFINKQRMFYIASVDQDGAVWASLLAGDGGFVKAVDDKRIEINLKRAFVDQSDPLWLSFNALANTDANTDIDNNDAADFGIDLAEPEVAFLFIELETRRRLRANGTAQYAGGKLSLNVKESFPNCPKYIQRRILALPTVASREKHSLQTENMNTFQGCDLSRAATIIIENSDTVIVASRHPSGHADISHRGGAPGFIELIGNTLEIPDYSGNGLFNTLGNLLVEPRAGLLIFDFSANRALQLTGTTSISIDDIDTERFWTLEVGSWRIIELPVDSSELIDYSPFNP